MNFAIQDCRPFSSVEGLGFRKLIEKCLQIGEKYGENVDLESIIPSARTLSRKTQSMAVEKKKEIKPHIQKLVSNGEAAATIDMWTDNFMKRNFLCATLHFQVNFELIDITLGIKSMDFMSSTATNIKSKLRSLFEEFGVTDLSNVVFVTDRGSNIVSALQDHTRLNCSAHLFSNILTDAFESTEELHRITNACKKVVKYFKKSNKQHMLETTLKSSCPTRWNSNFAMFESISRNYHTIHEIIKDNTHGRSMLNIPRGVLQSLVKLCEDFEIIFKKLQSSVSPTLCFVIPSINKIKMICLVQDNDEAEIAALKTNIISRLEKWSSNLTNLHKASLFLYPPAKSLLSDELNNIKEFCIQKLVENHSHASLHISQPTAETHSIFQDTQTSAVSDLPMSSSSQISHPFSPEPATSNLSFFFPSLLNASVATPERERDEVERYCNENVGMREDFDVMLWWKNNSIKYPKLSKLAMKVLSIPASSAASERVFSLAGNIITEKRNRLEPKTIDSLMFLNSLHKKNIW